MNDNEQSIPSYTESPHYGRRINELVPEGFGDETHDPPPDYEVSFEEAYKQWLSVKCATQDLSDLQPTIRDAEAKLSKEEIVLAELKKRSATLFDSLHKKKSTIFNILSAANRKGKSKEVAPIPLTGQASTFLLSTPDDSYTQDVGSDPLLPLRHGGGTPGGTRSTSWSSEPYVHGNRNCSPSGADVDPSLSRSKNLSRHETLKVDFEKAHSEEMKSVLLVEGLTEKVRQLRTQEEALQIVVATREDSWSMLSRAAERKAPIASHVIQLGDAVEQLASKDLGLSLTKKATADLTRARLTVQHAHHYFTKALNICDAVRGNSLGRATVGVFGGDVAALSKLCDYRAAVMFAGKAQVCLKECFRVLEPHLHTVPQDRRGDYDALKSMGLLQMLKIYNLLYGGRIIDTGVSTSIKVMLDKQETAFAHLTDLAVWIQNRVPECEAEEQCALEMRDNYREDLIKLWLVVHGMAR